MMNVFCKIGHVWRHFILIFEMAVKPAFIEALLVVIYIATAWDCYQKRHVFMPQIELAETWIYGPKWLGREPESYLKHN